MMTHDDDTLKKITSFTALWSNLWKWEEYYKFEFISFEN